MDTISSAEFRKTYAKLAKPVIVTVNGHPIGVWSPRELSPDGVHVWPSDKMMGESEAKSVVMGEVTRRPIVNVEPEPSKRTHTGHRDHPARRMTQADRDAILRRVNKGS